MKRSDLLKFSIEKVLKKYRKLFFNVWETCIDNIL